MMKLIPLLTENTKLTFDVVIPSMVGYGFSQKVNHAGCNVSFMGDLWFKLMQELGYKRFGVQGGEFGAGVSSFISLKYPKHVIGMHLNYIPGNYQPQLADGEELTCEENDYIKSEHEWYFSKAVIHSNKILNLLLWHTELMILQLDYVHGLWKKCMDGQHVMGTLRISLQRMNLYRM
jgi:pimeloyl-ACP methyl ester carboxylesterase